MGLMMEWFRYYSSIYDVGRRARTQSGRKRIREYRSFVVEKKDGVSPDHELLEVPVVNSRARKAGQSEARWFGDAPSNVAGVFYSEQPCT